MSDKTRKIIAIIALGFMAVFTVSFIMFLIKPSMFGGGVAFTALFSGAFGIILFFVVKGFEKKEEKKEEAPPTEREGEETSEK